jgi:hypothetical protein
LQIESEAVKKDETARYAGRINAIAVKIIKSNAIALLTNGSIRKKFVRSKKALPHPYA